MNPHGDLLVVGIVGSLRGESHTRKAVRVALRGAEEAGARTRLIDLKDYRLTFCDGEDDESRYPEDVFRLREEVRGAQGVILGTPEYHGGYSGVLKNALDLMGSDEFGGKMVGLVGVSGGQMGAAGALSGLRGVVRAIQGWVIPDQASVPRARNAFDERGNLRDEAVEKRLKTVGRQVARFAYLHTSEKVQELLRRWEDGAGSPEQR